MNNTSERVPTTCRACGRAFNTERQLEEHIEQEHREAAADGPDVTGDRAAELPERQAVEGVTGD
jgi:hypothetical protein